MLLQLVIFYQLPPVKGKSLHYYVVESSLWHENFKKVELNETMRERDEVKFTEVLNKLRVKTKQDKLTDEETAKLKGCETGQNTDDAVHIYPRNKQVDKYNLQRMQKKCADSVYIEAKDYEKE